MVLEGQPPATGCLGTGEKVAKIGGSIWALPRHHLAVGRARSGQPVLGLPGRKSPLIPDLVRSTSERTVWCLALSMCAMGGTRVNLVAPVIFAISGWAPDKSFLFLRNRIVHRLWGGGSFSLFEGASAVSVVAVAPAGCWPVVFQWWFEVVLPGWFPAYYPVVVMHLVVTSGAQQTHVVDVGVSLHCPGDYVMRLTPVCGGAASHTSLVPCYESHPLGGTGSPS